jgi:hypothetical protein
VLLEESVEVRAIPGFDRFSGEVSEQLQASGTVIWTPAQAWRLEGTLAAGLASVSIPGEPAGAPGRDELTSSLTLQARATWTFGRLELSGGLRGLYQDDPRVFHLPIKQWGAFVGAGFRDHLKP